MLFPPLDLIGRNEGLKALARFDVPTLRVDEDTNVVIRLLREQQELLGDGARHALVDLPECTGLWWFTCE